MEGSHVFVLLLALAWTLFPAAVRSLILCDGECTLQNFTELEICQKKTSSKTPLPVMALFPCNVPDFRARGLTVAAQMAVNEIEKNSTVLQDYRMELVVDNTMCDRLTAVRAFINQLSAGVRYMIIGPGCSTGATPIAEISPFWNITQISFTATSITLSDTDRFPNFLRTVSSDIASVDAYIALVRQYQWRQVAVISQSLQLFINLTAVLRETLPSSGVNVITENLNFIPEDPNIMRVIEALNVTGARVVILNTFEGLAREILCIAYRRGMSSPRYTFLSPFWFSEGWWRDEYNATAGNPYEVCSSEELAVMLDHSIAIEYFPEPTANELSLPTDVGLTPDEFWKEYVNNIHFLGYEEEEAIRQGRYAYDAVWAAALALHHTARRLDSGAIPGKTLADYSYSESEINDLILNEARSLKFRGVSGVVKFNQFGDREPFIRFFQYRYVESDVVNATQIAFLDSDTNEFTYVTGESQETVFPDGVTETVEFVAIHPALFSIYTILACVGIAFAIVCIVFNLVFSKKRIVKLSSPYLNVVLCVGAILSYVDVILLGMDQEIISVSAVDALCQAAIWFGGIGFALFFGTMLVKVFRVYYIFRNVRLNKSALKDWKLFLIVAAIVGMELVFLTVVTFVPGWRLGLEYTLMEREGGDLPLLIPYCDSSASTYWLPVYIGLNALLLLVGLFFAIETFNVRIRELNDSLLIMISVFSFAVFSFLLVTVGFLEIDDKNAFYAVMGIVTLALITEVLVVLFLTRMVSLYKNRSGEIDINNTNTVGNSMYQVEYSNSDDSDKVSELQSVIMDLKKQIREKKKTLEQSNGIPELEEVKIPEDLCNAKAVESLNNTTNLDDENRKESIKLQDVSEVDLTPEDGTVEDSVA